MTLYTKMTMPELQRYPWNLLLKKCGRYRRFSDSNCAYFCEFLVKKEMRKSLSQETAMKINSLKKQKHWYLIRTWLDKGYKGTVVNREYSSLKKRSLKITLTAPFNTIKNRRDLLQYSSKKVLCQVCSYLNIFSQEITWTVPLRYFKCE